MSIGLNVQNRFIREMRSSLNIKEKALCACKWVCAFVSMHPFLFERVKVGFLTFYLY